MEIKIYAWATIPSLAELAKFLQQHPEPKYLIFGLPEYQSAGLQTLLGNEYDHPLYPAWRQALCCVQFQAANIINEFQENTDLWLIPSQRLAYLYEYISQSIHWQTSAIVQQPLKPVKPWFQLPNNRTAPKKVLVIGAGIAGAATAYELARRGVSVTVLEARELPAAAASGNYQGLLYAKISPHLTAQTELLLTGYGYTRRLLEQLMDTGEGWENCGVLHLNYQDSETQRNQQLSQHLWHQHLYHAVTAQQASDIAGIPIEQDGLFWPQGVWIHPATLVRCLLQHQNIQLYTHCRIQAIEYQDSLQQWQISSQQGEWFSGSHIVFCVGAENQKLSVIQQYPTQLIRGQTSIAVSTHQSLHLKTALSAASYISPAWQGQHCYGATFIHHDDSSEWRLSDEISNQQALTELNPFLAKTLLQDNDFSGSQFQRGHAALRCDSYDHLPIVGALGEVNNMQMIYAKLALDKNYRINTPCPYYPNAYANMAHGSRGLATAPICAALIAAQICQLPIPMSQSLQQSLSPNRGIIRNIVRHKYG